MSHGPSRGLCGDDISQALVWLGLVSVVMASWENDVSGTMLVSNNIHPGSCSTLLYLDDQLT